MQHTLYLASLITGVVELVFFTGLIFGWSSINYVLKKEGYFIYLCESQANSSYASNTGLGVANASTVFDALNATTTSSLSTPSTTTDTGCNKQSESLNLVFTIASFMLSICTLPNGYIFDNYGTLVSRTLAILLVTLGALMLSFSTVETSLLLFPAMCGFSVGGILLLVTNMQLGNLYPKIKSSIITLMNGSLDSSSVVFLLVKLAYNDSNGYSFNSIFQFMTICTVFLWLRTIFVMPRFHVPFPLPKEGFLFGIHDCVRTEQQVTNNDAEQKLELSEKNVLEKQPSITIAHKADSNLSFFACIKTSKFWMNVFHFSVLQLRNYFFLGSFIAWLDSILMDKNSNGKYVTIFGVCQFFGIVCAPLNGFLIDGVKNHKSSRNKNANNLLAIAASACATSTWGSLFSLCVLIPVPKLQYVSFVLQVAFRSFLYGGNASFIALSFPIEHFGKIYGMTMTLAGIVTLLQFPLYSLVLRSFQGNFLIINIIFFVISLFTYIHPLFLYMNSKKIEEFEEKVNEVNTKKALVPLKSDDLNEKN